PQCAAGADPFQPRVEFASPRSTGRLVASERTEGYSLKPADAQIHLGSGSARSLRGGYAMSDKAVVILSGGLDSTTCMAVAADEGYEIYALTFDYGQRHRREVECARRVADHFHVREHRIVQLDFLKQIGGSSLTDSRLAIPSEESGEEIPNTYVPGRNLIFLSLAASFAEVVGARSLFIGVSAVDYSGYPDCRPDFVDAVNRVLQVSTRTGDRG